MTEPEVSRQLKIAVAAEYRKLASEIENSEKALFLTENEVGDRKAVFDDLGNKIGAVAVTAGTRGGIDFKVTDEAAALPWAVDEFGASALEEIVRLSPTGRTDVLAAAEKAHARGDDLPPGVELIERAPGSPSVSWTSAKKSDHSYVAPARELLVGMAARGVLNVSGVLTIEEAK